MITWPSAALQEKLIIHSATVVIKIKANMTTGRAGQTRGDTRGQLKNYALQINIQLWQTNKRML